jgi:hypothetical protein
MAGGLPPSVHDAAAAATRKRARRRRRGKGFSG